MLRTITVRQCRHRDRKPDSESLADDTQCSARARRDPVDQVTRSAARPGLHPPLSQRQLRPHWIGFPFWMHFSDTPLLETVEAEMGTRPQSSVYGTSERGDALSTTKNLARCVRDFQRLVYGSDPEEQA